MWISLSEDWCVLPDELIFLRVCVCVCVFWMCQYVHTHTEWQTKFTNMSVISLLIISDLCINSWLEKKIWSPAGAVFIFHACTLLPSPLPLYVDHPVTKPLCHCSQNHSFSVLAAIYFHVLHDAFCKLLHPSQSWSSRVLCF